MTEETDADYIREAAGALRNAVKEPRDAGPDSWALDAVECLRRLWKRDMADALKPYTNNVTVTEAARIAKDIAQTKIKLDQVTAQRDAALEDYNKAHDSERQTARALNRAANAHTETKAARDVLEAQLATAVDVLEWLESRLIPSYDYGAKVSEALRKIRGEP